MIIDRSHIFNILHRRINSMTKNKFKKSFKKKEHKYKSDTKSVPRI